MSEANLQSKNLDFNISIIAHKLNQNSEGEDTDITPLDTGVLSYLEIEDSLINPGITGNIAIKNSYNIMDRLKTFRSTEKTLFLDVNIEDTDSEAKSASDKKISVTTLLENSSIITKDITDNIIVFKFEEAQTSMLKKTSMRKLWQTGSKPDKSPSNTTGSQKVTSRRRRNNSSADRSPSSTTGSTTSESTTIGGQVKHIVNMWIKSLKLSKESDLLDEDFFEQGPGVNLQSYWWNIEDSVFDVLKRLVDNIQIESKLPLFKIQNFNDKDDIIRKFSLSEMFTSKHREFLEAMASGKETTTNFSDVYLEEFVLAPNEDNTGGRHSSGMYNTVEDYELVKADIETAREKVWCDYLLNMGEVDITSTNINITDFTDIVASFEENDLGGVDTTFNSAIPILRSSDKKILKVDRVDENNEDGSILNDLINNKVKSSFLYLNDVIVFNVRGQMFRKPGTFITINGGEVIGDTVADSIWFVVSVKHQFKELNYENEVVAVRLFGNSERYKKLVPTEEG